MNKLIKLLIFDFSLLPNVLFSPQALAMGMMTEYYHYIFTTLVSTLALLFLSWQNAIIYHVIGFSHCTLETVCGCFLFMGLSQCLSQGKNTSVSLSVWKQFFSSLRIKLNVTQPGTIQREKNMLLFPFRVKHFEPELQPDRNRWPWKADSLSSSWLWTHSLHFNYQLWKFNIGLFSPTFSPRVSVHNPERRKQKPLDIFHSDSRCDWSSPNFFDLATTKIARHAADEQRHVFGEPGEQKTESSDNSPEQMRLSPIWSIIANKQMARCVVGSLEGEVGENWPEKDIYRCTGRVTIPRAST